MFGSLPEIVGSYRNTLGNSGHEETKISRILLRKSWQLYYNSILPCCALSSFLRIAVEKVVKSENRNIMRSPIC